MIGKARAGSEVRERVNKWYSFILHCENSSADATDDPKRMVGKKVIEASRCHVKTCRINVCPANETNPFRVTTGRVFGAKLCQIKHVQLPAWVTSPGQGNRQK